MSMFDWFKRKPKRNTLPPEEEAVMLLREILECQRATYDSYHGKNAHLAFRKSRNT